MMATPASKPAAKKAAKKVAAKPGAGPSKSDEVRAIATAMKERGEQPRPALIVAEMAKKGTTVAPAQVSIVLKKMGFRPLRKRKGAKRAAVKSSAPKVAAKSVSGKSISVEEILAAKKAAASLGGTEKALAALQALKRIED
jgi:hypothetical protein